LIVSNQLNTINKCTEHEFLKKKVCSVKLLYDIFLKIKITKKTKKLDTPLPVLLGLYWSGSGYAMSDGTNVTQFL
jgi:hypothetical protein